VSKLVAWWSLLALFIRYYTFGDDHVFAGIPSLFPSTRRNKDTEPRPASNDKAPASLLPQGPEDNAAGHERE
jgi:hypothetical protein